MPPRLAVARVRQHLLVDFQRQGDSFPRLAPGAHTDRGFIPAGPPHGPTGMPNQRAATFPWPRPPSSERAAPVGAGSALVEATDRRRRNRACGRRSPRPQILARDAHVFQGPPHGKDPDWNTKNSPRQALPVKPSRSPASTQRFAAGCRSSVWGARRSREIASRRPGDRRRAGGRLFRAGNPLHRREPVMSSIASKPTSWGRGVCRQVSCFRAAAVRPARDCQALSAVSWMRLYAASGK